MFKETGLEPHLYLWIAGLVFLVLYIGYIFWFEHKESIDGSFWVEKFKKAGLNSKEINDITHDDSMWYYQRIATCVGYGSPLDTFNSSSSNGSPNALDSLGIPSPNGSPSGECPKYESFCPGGHTFGTAEDQVREVIAAIRKGGVHEDCPLIYSGTD